MEKIEKEIDIKHSRLRKLLDSKGLSGVLLSKQSNFQWFTGGKINDVIKNEDKSLVFLFVTESERYLIATRSDGDRVFTEEITGMDFKLFFYNWYDQTAVDVVNEIGIIGRIGADFNQPGLVNINADIVNLRIDLTVYEIDRYKKFCSFYTKLLTDFCINKLKPGISEKVIATNLTYECLKFNIRLPVLMVGSDERVFKYRHPCATEKKLNNYILIATSAERDGLHASLTRSAYFGKIPDELIARQKAVNFVQVYYTVYSIPGTSLKELFKIGKEAYLKVGFKDEWKNHLQGGITGYRPLEYLANATSSAVIRVNNILSWNPTISGVKSEDTILIFSDGPQQLSIDENWPYEEIEVRDKKFKRPEILRL